MHAVSARIRHRAVNESFVGEILSEDADRKRTARGRESHAGIDGRVGIRPNTLQEIVAVRTRVLKRAARIEMAPSDVAGIS